ncbi:MAG: type II toxin-antitoxin system Phd/YefM family antitoxin [Planctomycetia bacterium]
MEAAAPPLAIPIRRLRATLRAVVRAVEEGQERVVLTRHGRPVAALVPVRALDALDLLGRLLPGPAEVAAALSGPGEGGDETPGAQP